MSKNVNDRELPNQESPQKSSSFTPLRQGVTVGILILAAVIVYQFPFVRTYWIQVVQQGTLKPEIASGEACQPLQLRPVAQFDLSKSTVPRKAIRSGGPRKDGIPAISAPKLLPAEKVSFLQPKDRVIGITLNSKVRAYPLKVLNWHEIVNDRIADTPIAVTYCPLCDSAAVFDRNTPLGEREFGVSGLLLNSNVLMYDRTKGTESLWSQVKAQGISGPGAEKSLTALPMELTTWEIWVARHPETEVLVPKNTKFRNYQKNPYTGYFQRAGLMFPVQPSSDQLPAKEPVLGVWTSKGSRAYAISAFGSEPQKFRDQINGKSLTIAFHPKGQSLQVLEAEEGIQWMYSFWFAWYAFRPDTEVYQPTNK